MTVKWWEYKRVRPEWCQQWCELKKKTLRNLNCEASENIDIKRLTLREL